MADGLREVAPPAAWALVVSDTDMMVGFVELKEEETDRKGVFWGQTER